MAQISKHKPTLLILSLLLYTISTIASARILFDDEGNPNDSNENTPAPQRQRYGWYPSTTAVPKEYILFNETSMYILDRVATPGRKLNKRSIIFTTLRFGHKPDGDVLGMISTFCYHLNNQGMLKHTMLITTDERTWTMLHERGYPAFLDRAFPRREEYIDNVFLHDTDNREFDVEKHWWGWKMASLGFRVLYMDSDAVVLKNPLSPFDENYEVQGLSDWENLDRPLMDRAYTLPDPCRLYYIKHDENLPSKSVWSEEWTLHRLNTGESAFMVTNPCQSTGVWYLQPTDAVVQFMQAMVNRIGFHELSSWPKYQWDQTAWNDVIIHFLWGAGEHEPLRYRVLPFSQFANIHTHRSRREKEFGDDPIVLHLGGVHGVDKINAWKEEGYWMEDFVIEGRHAYASAPGSSETGGWRAHIGVIIVCKLLIVGGVYFWKKLRQKSSEYKLVVVSLQP